MSFLELAKKRASIRAYKSDPVNDECITAVVEAGRIAPSACNNQPWHIIVVRSDEQRAAVATAYSREWFAQAPVILIVCVEPESAWNRSDGKNYVDVDGAICMDHMTLCATDLGLGTCWIGAFDPSILRTALDLPEGVEPLAMTPLGYPAAAPKPTPRKSVADVVHRERW